MGTKSHVIASRTGGITPSDAISVAGAKAGQEFCVTSEYVLSAALTTSNGYIPLLAIPEGARLIQFDIDTPDLETDGSPTLTVDVGDSLDNDVFHEDSTAFRAVGVVSLLAGDKFTRYEQNVTLGIKVTANATGAVTSGTIRSLARFTYDPVD